MTTEESVLLASLGEQMKQMTKTMDRMSQKLDKLQDDHVTDITSRMAVQETKVGRLENIVYGLAGVALTELIALIFSFIKL